MRRHQTAVLLRSETESQPTKWERIVVNDIPDKELISNIWEDIKLSIKKSDFKMARGSKQTFFQEDAQMAH